MSFSAKVSIVIVNLDRADLTLECVQAVTENTEEASYEIIVVDNGSSTEEVEQLAMAKSFSLLRLNRNMFFGEASNIGAEHANGEYILFLNNDVKVTPGWLTSMLEVFDREVRVGAVGPKFLYPDGSLQEAGAYILADGWTWQFGKNEKHLSESYGDGIQVADYCSAACLLVKKCSFLGLAGFDPTFEPAYFEDVDLAVRLRSVGLFSYYCGQAVVFHEENVTSRRMWTGEQRNAYIAANRRKFVARWAGYLDRRLDEPCEPNALPPMEWKSEDGPNGKRRIIPLFLQSS